jgi:hypothetical protein
MINGEIRPYKTHRAEIHCEKVEAIDVTLTIQLWWELLSQQSTKLRV